MPCERRCKTCDFDENSIIACPMKTIIGKTASLEKNATWEQVKQKGRLIFENGGVLIEDSSVSGYSSWFALVDSSVVKGHPDNPLPTIGNIYDVIIGAGGWEGESNKPRNVGGWIQWVACSCLWGTYRMDGNTKWKDRLCSHAYSVILAINKLNRLPKRFKGDRRGKLEKAESKGHWKNLWYSFTQDTGEYLGCLMVLKYDSPISIKCEIYDRDRRLVKKFRCFSDRVDDAMEDCESEVEKLVGRAATLKKGNNMNKKALMIEELEGLLYDVVYEMLEYIKTNPNADIDWVEYHMDIPLEVYSKFNEEEQIEIEKDEKQIISTTREILENNALSQLYDIENYINENYPDFQYTYESYGEVELEKMADDIINNVINENQEYIPFDVNVLLGEIPNEELAEEIWENLYKIKTSSKIASNTETLKTLVMKELSELDCDAQDREDLEDCVFDTALNNGLDVEQSDIDEVVDEIINYRYSSLRKKAYIDWYEFDNENWSADSDFGIGAIIEPCDDGFCAYLMTDDESAVSFSTNLDNKNFQTVDDAKRAVEKEMENMQHNSSRTASRNFSYAEQEELQNEAIGTLCRNNHKLKGRMATDEGLFL